MKKWIIAFLLLTALGVGGIAVWRYVVPMRQVSDLYHRYEHADGIAASYIHNYPVNDTLTLDVTLLEATTDSGWARLVRDFCIPRIEDYPDSLKALLLDNDSPSIVFWNYPQGHPEQKMDTIDRDRNDILFVDHGARAISLFHTRQYSENDAVFKVKMNKYFEQAKEKEKE